MKWMLHVSHLLTPVEISVIDEDDGSTIADIGEDNEINQARGKLIAAAPELLKAVQSAFKRNVKFEVDKVTISMEAYLAIMAVIIRATI